ncbi:tryptophan synthase beta chain 1, chloroplastic-like [Durio zibethinus]|uniref:Tryptophan synthase beta chain 1, chloroplastic-like n=1 Tax=Durio zibethinus TaxID=66656 RepID=A0A6P5ZM56_DURZI|nr:tryptophan synthase beta chain 1, chloroplastic-like [Durio zibethinus]
MTINNAVAQASLAERLGKNRIIAESGTGQYGVATATALNVFRMRLLGPEKQENKRWKNGEGKPDALVACVGGGLNAMGLFHEFVNDKDVRLIGVEAAGFGLDSGKHVATLTEGEVGVLRGAMSYLLRDEDGQIVEPHSISAG